MLRPTTLPVVHILWASLLSAPAEPGIGSLGNGGAGVAGEGGDGVAGEGGTSHVLFGSRSIWVQATNPHPMRPPQQLPFIGGADTEALHGLGIGTLLIGG